jgi:hypothetical protein
MADRIPHPQPESRALLVLALFVSLFVLACIVFAASGWGAHMIRGDAAHPTAPFFQLPVMPDPEPMPLPSPRPGGGF